MNHKLTFHIPHIAFENNQYTNIPYEDFENAFGEKLMEIGIEGYHIISAIGFYKGRKYPQDLLSVFCTFEQQKVVISAFKNTLTNYHHKMKQEAYAYEYDGVLSIIKL